MTKDFTATIFRRGVRPPNNGQDAMYSPRILLRLRRLHIPACRPKVLCLRSGHNNQLYFAVTARATVMAVMEEAAAVMVIVEAQTRGNVNVLVSATAVRR